MSKKSKMRNSFILGTAQFSSNYGINNRFGKINYKEGKKIINYAYNSGIRFLDTAIAYNNCDKILGKLGVKNWNIITKINFPEYKINKFDLEKKLKKSLKNLRIKKFYGILVHNSNSLKYKFNKENFKMLLNLKKKNLVKKVGISTYGIDNLGYIMKTFKVDIIETSCNLFDTRIVDYLKKEKVKKNIEIYGRSIFLQGLLLMNNKKLPFYFKKWNKYFEKLNNWSSKNNLSMLETCLNFGFKNSRINKIIVGVDNNRQLKQIVKIIKYKKINLKFPTFKSVSKLLIDPRTWGDRRKVSNNI